MLIFSKVAWDKNFIKLTNHDVTHESVHISTENFVTIYAQCAEKPFAQLYQIIGFIVLFTRRVVQVWFTVSN